MEGPTGNRGGSAKLRWALLGLLPVAAGTWAQALPTPPASADICQVSWFSWRPAVAAGNDPPVAGDYNPVKYDFATSAGWWLPSRARDNALVADGGSNPEALFPGAVGANEVLAGSFRFTGMPGSTLNPDYVIQLPQKAWAIRFLDSGGGSLLRDPAAPVSYYVNYQNAANAPSAPGENNAVPIDTDTAPAGWQNRNIADITVPADGIVDVQIFITDPTQNLGIPLFTTTDCLQLIDAVDDDYGTVATGASTATVMGNDLLDGTKPATTTITEITDSTVTVVPAGGDAADLTVNADGTIDVAAGAVPGGYTLEYTLCEVDNADLCDTATVALDVQASADIAVTKSATPSPSRPGGVIAYTLTLANNGPDDATGVILTDDPDDGLDCASPASTASCSATDGASCPGATVPVADLLGAGVTIASLPVGSQVVVTLQCEVTATGL